MFRRHSTGTPSDPMTKAQLETFERQLKAKQIVKKKKQAGIYGRKKKLAKATNLGPPVRVARKPSKRVSYESDKDMWTPASLYKFEPARPLSATEQWQFEVNFRRLSPGKTVRLPDITKKMGEMNF